MPLFCYYKDMLGKVTLKLLTSISKFCQVLKAEMKTCVIRITAIDLYEKGAKTLPLSKHQDLPHFHHSFNMKPFLRPFEHLESYVAINYFFRCLNGWHHTFKIFCQWFERLASSSAV